MNKDLSYYLSLSYPIELIRDEGGFVTSHPGLPGCISQGRTADEAVANLAGARAAWLEVRFEDGLFIPEPLPEDFSGRISLRMPPALHASLAANAQRANVSLNQYMVTLLAESVGVAKGISAAEALLAEVRAALSAHLRAADIRPQPSASPEPSTSLEPSTSPKLSTSPEPATSPDPAAAPGSPVATGSARR
jgi:antitoxin HicB